MTADPPPTHGDRRLVPTIAWAALLVVFALAALLVAFERAMHFDGVPIDGPFQLYNALRRIAAGFRPGVDFQYFHGLGIPYIHYWLFRLFGAGLRGSELARELLTTAAYPLVFFLFFRAFAGDIRRALCLTAASLALSFALKLAAVFFALNGMLGLRSALPTLLPVVAFLMPSRRTRVAGVGLMLGFALFISTEQGLAAILAYAVVSAFAIARRPNRVAELVESAATLVLAMATLVACLAAVGGVDGMRGALRYNFRVIPLDQYWYFGTPPNLFIPSWGRVVPMLIGAPFIGAAVLLSAIATAAYLRRFWIAPTGDTGRRALALAFLPVYGLISCASLLGVFTGAYSQPCWRTVILVGLLEAARLADRPTSLIGRREWLGVPGAMAVGTLALSAFAVIEAPIVASAYTSFLPHFVEEHVVRGAGFSVNGMWAQTLRDGQRTLDAHRGPRGELPTLWSTYAGWLEARNGVFHPTFDYIIHALGPDNRRAYFNEFRATRPQLVQTVSPALTQYEAWIENNSWQLYEELLRSYVVTSTTPWSYFWERRSTPSPEPVVIGTMEVPAGVSYVELPPIPDSLRSPVTLLTVEVTYETRNPLHWLPILGANPRYLIGIDGARRKMPISLAPYDQQKTFPVFVDPTRTPSLSFRTFSLLPGASFTVRRLRVAVVRVDQRNSEWLAAAAR